jgi:hypothetical protein
MNENTVFMVTSMGMLGLILFNMTRNSTEWLDDTQSRIEKARGNSAMNINLSQVITHWRPLYDPRRFRATHTLSKRVKARTDSYSDNTHRHLKGAKEVSKYNYRTGGGVGPTARLYGKFA